MVDRQQQLAEERRRLIGFVQAVLRFMAEQASDVNSLLSRDAIACDNAPINGLRMAAGDMVEWCQDLAGEPLARLDAMLAAAGLPTLTAMRNSEYPEALRILARNRVRNEREWHVLSRFVVDTGDGPLSAAERQQAERRYNRMLWIG